LDFLKNINAPYRSLIPNFVSLSGYQATNFLVPLLVYPYLIRILGIDKFGLVAWAQAVIAFLVILNDYGFNLTITKEISLQRNEKSVVGKIFSQTFFAKVMLSFAGFVLLVILATSIPLFYQESNLLFWSFAIVIGQMFIPLWLYQGLEYMKALSIINLIAKLLYALLIFFLIHEPEDYLWVNFYYGAGHAVAGVIGLIWITNRHRIRLSISEVVNFYKPIRFSTSIFLSNLSGSVSINSYLIVLGFFVNAQDLGYFSIAEKVYIALRAIAVIIHQAVYPRVCIIAAESIDQLRHFLKILIKLILIVYIPIGLLVYFLAGFIVLYFAGEEIPETIEYLRILSFVPLIAALNIPACQTLLAYGFNRTYTTVSVIGAVFSIVTNLILIQFYLAWGTVCAILLTELMLTTMYYLSVRLKHPAYSVTSVLNIIR